MGVYVVLKCNDYEGCYIDKIFKYESDAQRRVKELNESFSAWDSITYEEIEVEEEWTTN